MKNLIIALLATSTVDSLNPIGITQQFILQGLVKKPRHIWYFIITTAIVNILFGYMVYYGIVQFISAFLTILQNEYSLAISLFELFLGICLLLLAIGWLVAKHVTQTRTNNHKLASDRKRLKAKFKHITPWTLINIGIISTVAELTSAVPYFAFLSVLGTYRFSFLVLTLVLICYNIIYITPFALLYIVYLVSKKQFDKIYVFFKDKCNKFLGYLMPVLLLVVAVSIICNGIINTLNSL